MRHFRNLFIPTFLAMSTVAHAQDATLIQPGASLQGQSQAEWSERWWQWAFSFERAKSPVADRTGAYCAGRQSGPVWFLAGTYGSRRVERRCTVPAGKTLFFPLINYVVFRPEGSNQSCMALASEAAAATDQPSALVLQINARRYTQLQAHRLPTRCFSLVPGTPPDAAANGYYVAVAPLPKGEHLIEFGGVLPDLIQAVTYRITVE